MGAFIDLTGRRFSMLVVLERSGTGNTGQSLWKCECDCGNETNVLSDNLRRGKQVSCGCYHKSKSITHGKTKSGEYKIWQAMKDRCLNPNREAYSDYGGRGIEVCDRWMSFENFYADMGDRPSKKHSIDRIDVNGNYAPGNCRWATQTQQNLNKRVGIRTSSGHKGVSWDKQRNKWIAYIDMLNDGKRICLGGFTDIHEAIEERKKAELKYHTPEALAN